MTDTATTTGYRNPSVTPRLTPSEAMMKANSPICAIENPHCMATLSDWPLSRKPMVPNTA